VQENSFDLLQANHTLSGIDIALWDLLGKRRGEPVYSLLGHSKAYPKLPYASQLFGDTPEETFTKAVASRKLGFRAVKFGWGPIGKGTALEDEAHFRAAREGLGEDGYLMVDIGTGFEENVSAAGQRLQALKEVNAYWLEEPFVNMALEAYAQLAGMEQEVPLAAGEGCNNYMQAAAMINYARLRYIQVDAGRIGGITVANRVAALAAEKGLTYVNHTFTSHLALSASLQPYAGHKHDFICEYPAEPKQLALDITKDRIEMDSNGQINIPEKPGLGVTVNQEAFKKYLVDLEIKVDGKRIYQTPYI
jgi:L-alanine-DL-glutamate epimerase-like enolase superfamily enzyme